MTRFNVLVYYMLLDGRWRKFKKIDTNKEINISQLDDLLLGNTYSSIPYVIL